ncbi:Pyrazinamidase/nicotinamidase [Neolecta irregularis DAH-3]|uniref:nicotinamidase n=1 Tax=Neolecta irregularis (strain DAH-3) TaxID=1198029 RepID=A0A1U7LP43_NEOID|nr:Pyrazinamidase/nicotinamidase [Neolecta irregularis DAH-3]|eukprot:OLL24425.1 Pyrazinamidase/nicotinamidase [Neolecta irregularis DAH-3]
MSALLIVDVQNDFIDGSLAVPGAEGILAQINELILQRNWDLVVGSQDWHPLNHISFAETHGKQPFTEVSISGETRMLWPVHCVQGSKGAEISPLLDKNKVEGTHIEVDAYSAFDSTSHQLSSLLRQRNVSKLYICGLATDYCVRASALDAVTNGFETIVVTDCMRGVDERTSELALNEMSSAGVKLVKMNDI